MAPTPQNTPLTWPKVKIGNQTLEVKYGILTSVTLGKWGIDPNAIQRSLFEFVPGPPLKVIENGIEVEKPNPQNIAKDPNYQLNMCTMFAAMVAHNFLAMGAEPDTPMEWALKIDEASGFLPFGDPNCAWQQVRNAVYEALGKRVQATTTSTPPTPAAAIPEPETPVLQ